ncbi:NADH:flavin oxidoreductase/NADH oxidase family protein [Streptomyces sp. GbtcB7]|uniref:NADH:flavin oxidoreductase/NADH oxidase family protein n=1 Tax=Streptomyces sp. GbtcB7 TaxID=2824752 RepID=UPI001C2FFD9F|nr:NADH:flavin oxidoreductase/NADH oxidase family protein [Streptomyces sp. GbtcB7]
MNTLFEPLPLANGSTLPNRVAKAAMEEGFAEAGQLPGKRLIELYRRWSTGGSGLVITGNVMVDARALTGPGAVVLDAHSPLEPFQRWAAAAKSGGAQVWMQLNHPGRQVTADMPGVAWSASGVALDVGKHSKRFAKPVEMTADDIAATIARFAETARRAEEAGFDGAEIHAAHGYLLSQFLSPLANRRTDRWGGSLENRARLLTEVINAVRAVVSPGFAVAVKHNSADFQRGGFDTADAKEVLAMLGELRVDLVELSGGSFESPAMQGVTADARTLAREAYFLSFAEELLSSAPMPLMLTGGITRRAVAERVLASGVTVVGMATALALRPDLPHRWQTGEDPVVAAQPVAWKDKALAAGASNALVRHQLGRLASGLDANQPSPLLTFVLDQRRRAKTLRRYRAWLTTRTTTSAPTAA